MAKILFLPYSHQLGTTFGLIELARLFHEKGNEIIFAGEGPYIRLANDLGFKVEDLIELDFKKYRKVVDGGNINFHDFSSLQEHIKEEVSLFKRIKPDLIITQARTSIIVSCRLLGIPYISLTVSFLTEYYDLPYEVPETFSLYPLTKIPIIGGVLNKNAKRFVITKSKQAVRVYNQVLKKHNLPLINSMYDTYAGDLTLIQESQLLFPVRNDAPKDKYIFTGPIQNRKDIHPIPTWIEEIKQYDGNFIYLSMGTSSEKIYPYILKRIAGLFEGLDNYYIITNSCSMLPNEFIIPKNVFITNTAPSRIMMELADITICHGGKGTLYDSIINRVPVLGIPQQAEQELNLRRIKALGLGDYILSKKIKNMKDEDIRKKIIEIISDEDIKKKLQYYSKEMIKEMNNLENIVEKIHTDINERKNI